jgi:signal transduction histidine kinase
MPYRSTKNRLKTKMIKSFVLAGVLPLVGGLVLTFWVGVKILQYSFQSNLKMISKEVSARVAERVELGFRLLTIIRTDPVIQDSLRAWNRKMERYSMEQYVRMTQVDSKRWSESTDEDPFVRKITHNPVALVMKRICAVYKEIEPDILVTDARGTLLAANDKHSDYYFGDRAWWKWAHHMDRHDNYCGEITYNPRSSAYELPVATMVTDGTEILGILRATIDISSLFPFISTSRIYNTGYFYLVDEYGRVILSSPQSPFRETIPGLAPARLSDENGWLEIKSATTESRKYYSGYSLLPFSLNPGFPGGEKRWYTMAVMDAGEVFHSGAFLILILVTQGVMLSTIFFLLAGYQAQRIIKPIHQLQQHVQEFGSGKLEKQIALDTRDEIQDLAESFNDMANHLNELYRNLEVKVEERTRELIKMNEELVMNQERLREVDKLKSEFLTHMSHELKTPLSSIIGFSELLLDEIPGRLNEEQRHNVLDILSGGEYLLKLINDILDFSRAESGKMELDKSYFDFTLLLEEVRQTFSSIVAQKNQKIVIHMKSRISPVFADEGKIRHVLMNLLDNAIKYSPPGTPITVEVTMLSAVPVSTGSEETDEHSKGLKVSVIDRGQGIQEENIPYIFNEFWRMSGEDREKQKGGAGLGLTLCKRYLELHDGWISVTSRYGEGSRFDFYLPL